MKLRQINSYLFRKFPVGDHVGMYVVGTPIHDKFRANCRQVENLWAPLYNAFYNQANHTEKGSP